jgi:AcrR family transcriptional regulator
MPEGGRAANLTQPADSVIRLRFAAAERANLNQSVRDAFRVSLTTPGAGLRRRVLTIDRSINNMTRRMTTSTATARDTRASADERREQVIQAAVKEFAAHGFHAASTTGIAKRAGISQPYIYALFPNKHELFLAVHRHAVERIRRTFAKAAQGADGSEERLDRMGQAYLTLLEDRDEILFQMQAHAAAGDPALREPVRSEFMGLMDDVQRIAGASRERIIEFFSKGMLLNVAAALDLPGEYCLVEPE